MLVRRAPRSLTFLLAAGLALALAACTRRPERAPRASRDGDRDRPPADARATGGDSTADRSCPDPSDRDSHAAP